MHSTLYTTCPTASVALCPSENTFCPEIRSSVLGTTFSLFAPVSMAASFHSPLLGLLPLPDLYMLLCLALILGHSYTHSSLALWLADLYAEKSLLWTELCPPQKVFTL